MRADGGLVRRDVDAVDASEPFEVVSQDIMSVFLNLFSNGFYAINRRRLEARAAGFQPTIRIAVVAPCRSARLRAGAPHRGGRPPRCSALDSNDSGRRL